MRTMIALPLLLLSSAAWAKSSPAYQHYSKGIELSTKKHYAEAAAQFHEAIDLNPNYFDSYIEYARAMVLLGKRKEGLMELSTAFRLAHRRDDIDKLSQARSNLSEIFYTNATFQSYQNGLNYLRLDHASSAVYAFERAYAVEPDNVLILLGYADAFDSEDNQKQRTSLLEKAFQLNEGKTEVRVNLADAVLAKQPERAVQLLKPVIQTKDYSEEAAILYARALSSTKHNEDALNFLKDCTEKNTDWLMAQFWLGKLYASSEGGNWQARKYLLIFQKRAEPLLQGVSGEASPSPYTNSIKPKELKAAKTEADTLLTRVNKALE